MDEAREQGALGWRRRLVRRAVRRATATQGQGEATGVPRPLREARRGAAHSIHGGELEHLEFAFRRSTTSADNDLQDIDSFLKDSQKGFDDIKEKLKDKKDKKKVASGFKPLLSTFRALDLLHGYVMGLPVTVDFLGIYAKRAQEAAREADTAPAREAPSR